MSEAMEAIANPGAGAAIEMRAVERVFHDVGGALPVLRGVNLAVAPGEMVALVGPSGAGKSTLLHIAGLLEPPSAGQVLHGGRDCAQFSERERTLLRRDAIGIVYQFHHLMPDFSAIENVMMPQLVAGLRKSEARDRAEQLLAMVGLSERADHRPSQLSGGEQQRVAIVRAIANVPSVLLADEPTGNLDPITAADVFAQLRRIVEATGIAALIATHNMELARQMDRVLELRDGRVAEVG